MVAPMGIELSARIGAMIVHSAAASGADPKALEGATGFRAELAQDPDARIPLALETALWAEAERLTGDPDFGLHTALRIQPGAFDVLDYAVRTAPTLRAALDRLARYNRLEHDAAIFTMSAEVAPGDVALTRVTHTFRGDVPGQTLGQHRHSITFTLASLLVIGQQMSGAPLIPREVTFHHAAAGDLAAQTRVFGVAPRYAAQGNAVVFVAADLERPVPAADPRLWSVIERHAEALLAARPEPSQGLGTRVRQVMAELLQTLPEGPPTLATMAARLRLSERSLQRYLRDEGTTFDALLEGLRKDLALSYLRDPHMAISEVAYLLGYSEPSAFHRAFRRWTGVTPGEYRAPHASAEARTTQPPRSPA